MSAGARITGPPFVAPASGSEEDYLVQNYLDHERGQLDRLSRWRRGLLKTPIGTPFEEALPLLLRPVRSTLLLDRAVGGRTVYSGYPISGRPVEVERIVLEANQDPPVDRPVVLRKVRSGVIFSPRGGAIGDRAIYVEEFAPATLREFLPELPSPSAARDRLGAILDQARDARTTIGSSFRSFAGTPPMAGIGAGLDAVLGAPNIDTGTASEAARTLASLRPFWERSGIARRGRRTWAGTEKYPIYAPYSVLVDTFSGRWGLGGHSPGSDRSSLLASATASPALEALLKGADDPVVRPSSEIEALASRPLPLEALGPASSILLLAHAIDPRIDEETEIARAVRSAVGEISESFRTFLSEVGSPNTGLADLVPNSPHVKEAVLRSAMAQARTEYSPVLGVTYVSRIAKDFADSVINATAGVASRDLRQYRVGAGLIESDRETRRFELIDGYLNASSNSVVGELWSRVENRDLWRSAKEFEGWLDERIREGRYIQIDGRLSKV